MHTNNKAFRTKKVYVALVQAPKVPFICDDCDTPYEAYKCGNCGCRTCIEDANFCPKCGAVLYFEEE